MKIVLDTNVLIDALRDNYSYEARIIEAVLKGEIRAAATIPLRREYRRIIRREISDPASREYLENFLKKLEMAIPTAPEKITVEGENKEDQKVLEAAYGADADYLISSDQHLTSLPESKEIVVLTPAEFWSRWRGEEDRKDAWQDYVRGWGRVEK
jgi:putative PIN family toxin of toxin-antitoxin system